MTKLLNQTTGASPYVPMVGVLGAACSSASLGAAAVSEMLQIPQISHSSTSPSLSDPEFDFFSRVIVSDAYGGIALAKLVKAMGHKRMGIVFNTATYSRTFYEEFTKELRSDGYDEDLDFMALPYPSIDDDLNQMLDDNQDENGIMFPRANWSSTFTEKMEERHRVFELIFSNFLQAHYKTFVVFAQGNADRQFILECAQQFNLTGTSD